MKEFWGYYKNEKYCVGCNGATVYIYDNQNKELAKFKDVKYAYIAKFMPHKNNIIVKTTEGSLAIYSLDELKLIKKIVITRIGAQDEGCCFTPDGKYFYNIEKPYSSLRTQLSKYETSNFELVEKYFEDNSNMHLQEIEFDETGRCYLLGFMRNNTSGVYDYGFVGELVNENVENIKKLDVNTYDYISAYKSWELMGFTKKSLQWSTLKEREKIVPVTLKELYESNS